MITPSIVLWISSCLFVILFLDIKKKVSVTLLKHYTLINDNLQTVPKNFANKFYLLNVTLNPASFAESTIDKIKADFDQNFRFAGCYELKVEFNSINMINGIRQRNENKTIIGKVSNIENGV